MRIVKRMSLSEGEFRNSLDTFAARSGYARSGDLEFRVGEGRVAVSIEPLPPRTLGALLVMPQADVAIEFHGVGDVEQGAFVRAFDIAFQRGGG